jgi:hypothetical protein
MKRMVKATPKANHKAWCAAQRTFWQKFIWRCHTLFTTRPQTFTYHQFALKSRIPTQV